MKIGILTLLGTNYGGTLQAFALKYAIEKMNIEDVSIINYMLHNRLRAKEIVKKFVYYNRNKKFKDFKHKYLNLTHKYKSKQLDEYRLNYDVYIVGSDQIWNEQIPMEYRRNYYLGFVKNKSIKMAYAASKGQDIIDENEKKIIGEYLNKFDYISMREKTGVNLYQPLTKNKIENVLDPTLLLTSNDWDKIEVEPTIKNEYIFSYTLGAEKKVINTIDQISKKLNIGIVEISYKKNYKNEIKNINDAGPKEFIGLIKNSKYVVTNSFHGMVFSIIYKKSFWVFKRGKMNSRINDLLEILNLKDRIIDLGESKDINEIDLKQKIDYEGVYKILEKEREKSLNFLKKALDIKEK